MFKNGESANALPASFITK